MINRAYLLAIETSCDETAITVVDINGNIVKEQIWSQIEIHNEYGGVVPEIASRNHAIQIQIVAKKIMQDINVANIVAVAATAGPGLIGGLLSGVMFAKGLSQALNIPFIAINHLEGHALSHKIKRGKISKNIAFPYLLLLISGGHSQMLIARNIGDYELLGETIDDAIGEAFDKSARLLGFSYPGGAQIEKAAQNGNENRFNLPIGLKSDKNTINFSFSGLKTAVLKQVQFERNAHGEILSNEFIQDISASLQFTIAKALHKSVVNGMKYFSKILPNCNSKSFVVCGGVAANIVMRKTIKKCCDDNNFSLFMPLIQYCTDNATMIAAAALEYYHLKRFSKLEFCARAHWPLADMMHVK